MPLIGLTRLAVHASPIGGFMRREDDTVKGDVVWYRTATDEDLNQLPELERVAVVYRMAYFIGENRLRP